MKRVNAPVPDYNDNDSGEFHYFSTEQIANGDFCKKFSFKKSERVERRKKNKRFRVLELNSTNYWNAVENPNSHERALPVRTEVSKLHQSIVITLWIKYWVGRDL